MAVTLNSNMKIDWVRPEGCPAGFEPRYVVSGRSDGGGMALEIAVTQWGKNEPPTREALTRLHTIRLNKRANPLVLVIETPRGTLVYGPNTATAPAGPLAEDQASRILQAALDEPTALAARARLSGLVQALETTSLPGVQNSGLFASHELRVGVPQRSDWQAACTRSKPLLMLKGQQLIEKLGFKAGRAGAHALLLSASGPRPEAIAVMLDEREAFDADSPRFAVSPVAYGLRMAEQSDVPWLIMLRGSQLRLYPARIEHGVGRKGLAETFFELDLPQLTDDTSGYLDLIFSANALSQNGTTYEILRSSAQYAVALGERLRDKVYEDIIPELSVAVADALIEQGYEMDAEGLDLAYQLTLRVFFRMLFQVYAEDRKLLPYGENAKYDRNAIKTLARDLAENPDQEFDEESTSLWDDLAQVWRVIDSGDKSWGVPAYNGGLFSSDKELNPHGHILKDVRITNSVMGPVLKALLLDASEEGELGQIDFRSLSVREFGTIYEGLLESSLGLAEVDLTLDDKGTWIPAKKTDEVWAYAGQVYFHNTSGQRKGTGSYFTPSFVVEHLLERSLDPALEVHLSKVERLIQKQDYAGAAELFFDFKVADLAMGSGHFLTAAIDHIEQRMAAFLAEEGHFIAGVAAELKKLESAATEALGPDAPEPERSSLLRRQIARRCIYGLDINPIAVELARVSIWIHTFVRGLPMSSLDHNLVCANSLTGIGSVEEALNVLVPGRKGQMTLFDQPIEEALERSRTVLVDAARLAETTKEETRAAARASQRARREAEQAKLLFDAAVVTRLGQGQLVGGSTPELIASLAASEDVQAELEPLAPAHMPVLFPEVFLRENQGFDVLLGNPPWDKIETDKRLFVMRHFPGALSGISQDEKDKKVKEALKEGSPLHQLFGLEQARNDLLRKALVGGPFPGMGVDHPDLAKAFAWRNLALLRDGGLFGVVLPRVVLSGRALEDWRKTILSSPVGIDIWLLGNIGGYVFPNVHQQKEFVLAVGGRQERPRHQLCGPLRTRDDWANKRHRMVTIDSRFLGEQWEIPNITESDGLEILETMFRLPRFETSRIFKKTVYETDQTKNKGDFIFSRIDDDSLLPVYKGESFDLWKPDTGKLFARANRSAISQVLLEKAVSGNRRRSSAFFNLNLEVSALPLWRARVAYRWTTNSTNSRTFVVALVPPETVLTNGTPYLLTLPGEEKDEAFLLGLFSSVVFDWLVRAYVEGTMRQGILNRLPVPDISDGPLQRKLILNSAQLAAVDNRFKAWANAVGVEAGVIPDMERESTVAENDALAALLYGLSREQVQHIFETFHRGWNFSSRLQVVLQHFDALSEGAS